MGKRGWADMTWRVLSRLEANACMHAPGEDPPPDRPSCFMMAMARDPERMVASEGLAAGSSLDALALGGAPAAICSFIQGDGLHSDEGGSCSRYWGRPGENEDNRVISILPLGPQARTLRRSRESAGDSNCSNPPWQPPRPLSHRPSISNRVAPSLCSRSSLSASSMGAPQEEPQMATEGTRQRMHRKWARWTRARTRGLARASRRSTSRRCRATTALSARRSNGEPSTSSSRSNAR